MLLIKHPKTFSISVSNLPRYSTFRAFRIFSVHVQIRSVYSQYRYRFILCILSIWTDSFRVFSVYKQQISSKIYVILHILRIHTDSFHLFSVYEQIHFAYFQYTYRFIPRIQRMCPNNFAYS
jgi:hypothetical protein